MSLWGRKDQAPPTPTPTGPPLCPKVHEEHQEVRRWGSIQDHHAGGGARELSREEFIDQVIAELEALVMDRFGRECQR